MHLLWFEIFFWWILKPCPSLLRIEQLQPLRGSGPGSGMFSAWCCVWVAPPNNISAGAFLSPASRIFQFCSVNLDSDYSAQTLYSPLLLFICTITLQPVTSRLLWSGIQNSSASLPLLAHSAVGRRQTGSHRQTSCGHSCFYFWSLHFLSVCSPPELPDSLQRRPARGFGRREAQTWNPAAVLAHHPLRWVSLQKTVKNRVLNSFFQLLVEQIALGILFLWCDSSATLHFYCKALCDFLCERCYTSKVYFLLLIFSEPVQSHRFTDTQTDTDSVVSACFLWTAAFWFVFSGSVWTYSRCFWKRSHVYADYRLSWVKRCICVGGML